MTNLKTTTQPHPIVRELNELIDQQVDDFFAIGKESEDDQHLHRDLQPQEIYIILLPENYFISCHNQKITTGLNNMKAASAPTFATRAAACQGFEQQDFRAAPELTPDHPTLRLANLLLQYTCDVVHVDGDTTVDWNPEHETLAFVTMNGYTIAVRNKEIKIGHIVVPSTHLN